MGNSKSKSEEEKLNKNHHIIKGFRLGVSLGKDSLTMEGHAQMGWTNKTVKNYSHIPYDTNCQRRLESPDTSLEPSHQADPDQNGPPS